MRVAEQKYPENDKMPRSVRFLFAVQGPQDPIVKMLHDPDVAYPRIVFPNVLSTWLTGEWVVTRLQADIDQQNDISTLEAELDYVRPHYLPLDEQVRQALERLRDSLYWHVERERMDMEFAKWQRVAPVDFRQWLHDMRTRNDSEVIPPDGVVRGRFAPSVWTDPKTGTKWYGHSHKDWNAKKAPELHGQILKVDFNFDHYDYPHNSKLTVFGDSPIRENI